MTERGPALVPEPAGADQPFAEHLLLAATAGDEAAFAAIYLVLQPRLVRYARGLVGQDADDVSAEAWLQIARDIGRFSGDPQSFCGWAARVVRNRALDHLRALGRRPVNSAPIEEFFDVAAANDTAGEAIEHLSTNAALDLIATLPREQAEAVLLRAVVGLDAKTAGEVLGKSAGAVRVSAHRGLKNLAKRL